MFLPTPAARPSAAMKNRETSFAARRRRRESIRWGVTSELAYSFGYFRLLPAQRLLLAGEQPIKLGARAFDLLAELVRASDRMLTKSQLLEAVWPRLVVEENNLNVQVVALRKVLGHAAIATIPGRGYRFVMPVQVTGGAPSVAAHSPPSPASAAAPATGGAAPAPRRTNLAGDAPTLFGRADDVSEVLSLLGEHRLVTLAGAGGIGKTRLGQVVAHRLMADPLDAVWWVELAALNDPAFVAATVARVLGLDPSGTRPATQLVASALRTGRAVLVLDNCEHLIDAVADLVSVLRVSAPDLRILVTSQEALKAGDEHVFRLGTLTLPPGSPGAPPTPHQVASSGAGALFVARARAADPRFQLGAGNVDAVVEICRCLDGIPLAIELAAARLPLLGIEGVRLRLKERFNVLTGGTRAVLRRHQTLRAALDWSHGLLSEPERTVFRRLGVFAGGFTLDSAQFVCADDTVDTWDVLEHLGTLVDKSLVLAEGESLPRYRLLETTRLFALEQLGDAGETESMLRQHAQAMVVLLEGYERRTRSRTLTNEEDRLLAAEVDNVRFALDWLRSRADGSDDALAIALAGVAVLALVNGGGVSEAFDRTVVFGPRVGVTVPPDSAARYWLALAFWGAIVSRPEAYEAAQRAADLFRSLGDDEHRFIALSTRIAIGARIGEVSKLEPCIEEARRIERPEWPAHLRRHLHWSCYRFMQAAGRPEEALGFALARAAEYRNTGAPLLEQITSGDLVADCEMTAGRVDAAEARCRAALASLRGQAGYEWGLAHVLETLAFVCTAQEKIEEAFCHARAALQTSRDVGMHFRLLEAMALNAARQGRLQDAASAVAYVDRLYAERGEVRWPLARTRRVKLDTLLAAGLAADERARLATEGTPADLEGAFERAFGPSAPTALEV